MPMLIYKFANALQVAQCIANNNESGDVSDEKIAELKQLLNNPILRTVQSDDAYGWTLLYFAVVVGRYKVVKCLLDAGADTEIPDKMDGNTPLMWAICKNNLTIARLLLSYKGTGIKDVTNKHKESLSDFVLYSKIGSDIIPLLLEKGFDIYNDDSQGLLKRAVRPNICPEVFKALLTQKPHLQTLFDLAREGRLTPNDPSFPAYTHLSCSDAQEFALLEYEINCIHLFCINHHYSPDATQILFDYLQKLLTHKQKVFYYIGCNNFLGNLSWKDEREFVFLSAFQPEKEIEIKACFDQIVALFGNPQRCIELLQKLDDQVAMFKPEFDFTKIKPGVGLKLYSDLRAPSPLEDPSILIQDTHSLLGYLLRLNLNKYGIETQPYSYVFSGFVNPDSANEIVKAGGLFTEQMFMGNAAAHGRKIHKIQVFLIGRGIEKGDIKLPKDMTLRDLLTLMVSTPDGGEGSVWTTIIDFVEYSKLQLSPYKYNLGSPYRLNSLLLMSRELPNLCGLIRNSHFKKIRQFQDFIWNIHGVRFSYESIVQGAAFSRNVFDCLDLGTTNKEISQYYQHNAKSRLTTEITVDEVTGIVTKNAEKQFAIITELFRMRSTNSDKNEFKSSCCAIC